MATAKMPASLYECYLLDTEETYRFVRKLPGVEGNPKSSLFKKPKPMSRKKFEKTLQEMTPEDRMSVERRLRTPRKQLLKEGRLLIEKALHEYETNPEVRKQAAREIDEMLEKMGVASKKRP